MRGPHGVESDELLVIGPPGDEAVSTEIAEQQLADPGAVRNTLLQLVTQAATTLFTAGLTLYLVRALGASSYGLYALALGVGGLLLFPAGFGLPMSVGRFLADHRGDLGHVRAILRLGLRLQVPAAVAVGIGLFAASGAIADAYGNHHLGWPLRWMALAMIGQALFAFLAAVVQSVRRVSIGLWMVLIESTAETFTAIALVAAGAGAAGALLGKAIGYFVAVVGAFYLIVRLLGGLGERGPRPERVGLRQVTTYAGALFIVDMSWSAIIQIDILLVGALLTSQAVGSLGAVNKILTVLGYLGIAVSGGVAPRLSLGGGTPDVRAFNDGIRYLILVQGVIIAPLVVWYRPVTELLLGSGYPHSAELLRVLTIQAFVSAPAALISLAVSYLGEARRRVPIMLANLVLGVVLTYVLLRTIGLVGAAVADDAVQVVYVGAHLWICSKLISVDGRRLASSLLRTLAAAGVMALVMLAIGTNHLSALQWIFGVGAGVGAYAAVLLLTGELSLQELRSILRRLRPSSLIDARNPSR